MKIAADSKIPFLKGVFEPYCDVEYLSPAEMTREKIKDADAIIVRTRNRCDELMLEGTNVKFIATATIGFDHIDTEYCRRKGIKWVNAPGCNSVSVMQYMSAALTAFSIKKNVELEGLTLGIVGVGNVGSKVEKAARLLGMKLLLNDPPRERREGKEKFTALEQLASEADIISFHVPLIKEGIDKTFHLAGEKFWGMVKPGAVFINTSRGEAADTQSLKEAMRKGIVSSALLDVWENEPEPDLELLGMAEIGTPHIAGYSAEGKANGTTVCVNAINEFFNIGIEKEWYPAGLPRPLPEEELVIDCTGLTLQKILYSAIKHTYDIYGESRALKESPGSFEQQRNNYGIRREFGYYKIKLINAPEGAEKILAGLGFKTGTP